MKIHLLAIDLDGTLLNTAKRITQPTAAAIAAARKAGVRVVLASARPPRTVLPYYAQLELDAPMINYNGALVFDPPSSRVLMHRPVPAKVARGIAVLAREQYADVLVSAEILDRWYTDRVDSAYLTETARLYKPDLIAPMDRWLSEAVTKLLLLGEPARLAELIGPIHKHFTHQVSVVQTEEFLLQIMHATVSKLQALRVVAAELGVTREQVMAIGDNANDVGMLSWAGTSAAMANATREALAAADFITDHNDADGVAEAIQKAIFDGRHQTRRM
ncbi:MAG: Cof-type HAD-IIB family hydrolase [Phycisphaerae bacterium]